MSNHHYEGHHVPSRVTRLVSWIVLPWLVDWFVNPILLKKKLTRNHDKSYVPVVDFRRRTRGSWRRVWTLAAWTSTSSLTMPITTDRDPHQKASWCSWEVSMVWYGIPKLPSFVFILSFSTSLAFYILRCCNASSNHQFYCGVCLVDGFSLSNFWRAKC